MKIECEICSQVLRSKAELIEHVEAHVEEAEQDLDMSGKYLDEINKTKHL